MTRVPVGLCSAAERAAAMRYHHIDNVWSGRVPMWARGCTVVPRLVCGGTGNHWFGHSMGLIELVYGPHRTESRVERAKLVDTDRTVDTLTLGQDVLDNDDGIVSTGLQPAEDDEVPYPVVDLAGGIGTFSRNLPYPNGVANETMEDFALQAVAEVVIPAGTWTIGFGSRRRRCGADPGRRVPGLAE